MKRGILDAQQARDAYAANRAQPAPGGLPEVLLRRGVPADAVARLKADVIAKLQSGVHVSRGSPEPPRGSPEPPGVESSQLISSITKPAPTPFAPDAPTLVGVRSVTEVMQAGAPPTRRDLPGSSGSRKPGSSVHKLRPRVGSIFGRYELLAELGRGGMGVVFRARQTDLDRVVALKMLLMGEAASPVERERFFNEAKHAAKLDHRCIVTVHDVGEIDGIHYFTMDYIEGKDLGQIIKMKGKLEPNDAIDYALQVCEALAYAHEQGVVHRDLKPGNVLVDKQGRARIGDFGIAKDLARSSTTQAGEVLGTPNYMPPEQADGNSLKVDGRADIYSLGAVLYEMLSGHPPFEGKTGFAILTAVMNERPTPPSKHAPGIPPDLETIVLKCLEKGRELRYPTVADLASDLKRFQAGQSIEAQRSKDPFLRAKGKLVIVLAVTLAAVLGGGLVYVRDVKQRQEAAQLEADRRAKEAEEAANRARLAEAERLAAERATSLVHEAEESALHGDKDHAVQLALDAVERAPKLALAHATLGKLYLELRSDVAKAIEESEAAIALDGAAVEPHITRARALAAGKRWDEALTECRALERLGVEGRASAGRIRGETFLARGELDAATSELEHAADIAPRDASVRVLLAHAYLQAKKYEEAERTATAARELDARLVDALKTRAEARARIPGKVAEALADANEAVRLAPSDPEARALVDRMQAQATEPGNDAEEHKRVDAATEALKLGDRKTAEAYLAAPRTGRECPYVNVHRGFLAWNMGRLPEAEESFSRAHDQDPRDMGTLGNRGLLRMQLGRNEEAIADFDAALASGVPEGLYPALIGRNKALAHLKRWDEAEKGWVKALELFKEPSWRASALHDRAKTCWMARQRWAEAESDLSEAIALMPGYAHYWCDRGMVREKKGDKEGALADWKSALDGKNIEPNDEKIARESIKRVESP